MTATIVLLIVVGASLLVIEFIVPGAVIGILGVVALVTAVVLSFVYHGAGTGMGVAAGALVFVAVSIGLWMKYFHRTYFGRKLTLNSEVPTEDVNSANIDLIGKQGVAQSELRPSGKALVEGRKIDVVAETGLIDKGDRIEVISIDGVRIVVRAV